MASLDKTSNSEKTSSDKNSSKSSSSSSKISSSSSSASKSSSSKSVGSSKPATSTSGGSSKISSSSSKADKSPSNYVAFDTSGEARDSAPSSSASKTSKTPASKSAAAKNPSSTGGGSSGMVSQAKKPTASPVSRSGPSWEQFDDYVNNTGAFGRRPTSSPVSKDGPSWEQFDDYVNNTGAFGRRSTADEPGQGPSWQDLMALQQLGQRAGNPLEEAVRAGEERRAQREAEGVTPSEGAFDWNGILHDLNAPYRQREEDAGGRPFEGPIDWTGIGAAIFGGPSKEERDRALWLERQGLPADYAPVPVGHGPPGEPRGAGRVDPESGFIRDPVTGAYYRPDLLPDRTSWVGEDTAAAEPVGGPDPIGTLLAGLDAEKRRLAGELPDPGRWFQYPGTGGIDTAAGQLPGQTEGMSDEALYAQNHPVAPPEEPTLWDKVVEGGGKVLENTALGGVVKGLFPDIWYGAGEAMKGLSLGTSGGIDAAATGPAARYDELSGRRKNTGASGALGGMTYAEAIRAGENYGPVGSNTNDRYDRSYRQPPVKPTPTPPVPNPPPPSTDLVYDRFGRVVFPDMPPYNPGRDDEWLYFRQMADGGLVRGYAEGGEVDPLAGQDDPRMEVIAEAEDVLEDLVEGEKPGPEEEAALRKFVELFGDAALRQLHDNVKSGMKMRPGKGRMVSGPGGPKDDAVPAMIDGEEPAALSDGEFVLPAEAVMGAGGGDRERGAAALQELSDRLSNMRKAPAGKAA